MLATHLESFWWPTAPENKIDLHFTLYMYIFVLFSVSK